MDYISRQIGRMTAPKLLTTTQMRVGLPNTTGAAVGTVDLIAIATGGTFTADGVNTDDPNLLATGGYPQMEV